MSSTTAALEKRLSLALSRGCLTRRARPRVGEERSAAPRKGSREAGRLVREGREASVREMGNCGAEPGARRLGLASWPGVREDSREESQRRWREQREP